MRYYYYQFDLRQHPKYANALPTGYVDESKNYHDTDSFGRDDLPLVAKLADQAHTFIFERLAEARSDQSE